MEASNPTTASSHSKPGATPGPREHRGSINRRSPSDGDGNSEVGAPRLYHTLTACTRCRSRKTRCDAGLPKCGPCERSNTHCEFFDSAKQKTIPRSYVVHLQNKVRALEEEVARREALLFDGDDDKPLNNEDLVRGIGAVKFGDYEHYKEPRYMGSSSGVTVTRLVLESAKKDLEPEEFRDMTFQHRQNVVYMSPEPKNSDMLKNEGLPEARLPPRHLGETLVSFFCKKALYMLPVLHEPTFMKEVADVYEGSTDPSKVFKLNMVLAISLQKYSSKYAQVADSYFLAGLKLLEEILEPMDHSTLQCLLIMVQYALVKPTRIAAYHIVGLCVRLCIQLGYHQERTIMLSEQPLDPITKDMRRRLFWTLASMEYGLSHVLGRPSAFATSDAYVDVKFYEPVDDVYITAGGIISAPPSGKKLISMHFFEMRRLQAEVRRTLYQNPRETPTSDQDPWFVQMYDKCNKWKASCPSDDEGSGLSEAWFYHRYNNILIFMYRPSPQIPQPSLEATIMCFNCAVENVQLEKRMYETQSADLTWVFLHQIYTVTLTIIWALYNPEIRRLHPKHEVEGHIRCQIQLLISLAELWPGAEAAADLFARLAGAALRNYITDKKKSPASSHPASPPQYKYRDHHSPPPRQNSPYHHNSPLANHPSPYSASENGRSVSDTPSPHAGLAYVSSVYDQNVMENSASSAHAPSIARSSASPPHVPEPSYRDFQGMIFDSNFMSTMFTPADIPQAGVPDWLQAWDPSVPAAPTREQLEFVQREQQQQQEVHYAGVLNPQSQHDELLRILETEAMQEFDFSTSPRTERADETQRSWGYASGDGFY